MKIKSLAFCTRLRLVRPPFKDELSCPPSKIGITAKIQLFFTNHLTNNAFCRIYAIKVGKPKPTKRGSKNQNNFVQIQVMQYDLVGIGVVKMTVGVKKSGEKIQYCITAITA